MEIIQIRSAVNIIFSSLSGSSRVSYTASNNFLIFIGIILLLALASIIIVSIVKKIRNKKK